MWDQLDATISDFIFNHFFLNMFQASLRPSSGGQTVFSLHIVICPGDQLDATISDFIVN